jgi:hypothetical protein
VFLAVVVKQCASLYIREENFLMMVLRISAESFR